MTARFPTCYMCAAASTSKEHAPPQCLFPEEAEIGRDLRKNLISVRSCDAHNSKKSEDDEFLRAVILLAAVESNKIAQHQFLGKFLRGAERNRDAHQKFFKDAGLTSSNTKRALKLDRDRFDKCVEHIAKAIFFHTFKSKWSLPIAVVSPNFYSEVTQDGPVAHLPSRQTIQVTQQFLATEPLLGDNPEVFMYRLRFDEVSGMFAFAGRFYEFFEIYCASSKGIADATAG